MDYLRMYLGEMAGVALVLAMLFVASAIAMRYFPNQDKTIRVIRKICVAATIAGFVVSLIPSLAFNQIPRGRVNRTSVEQDQKAFELRHAK